MEKASETRLNRWLFALIALALFSYQAGLMLMQCWLYLPIKPAQNFSVFLTNFPAKPAQALTGWEINYSKVYHPAYRANQNLSAAFSKSSSLIICWTLAFFGFFSGRGVSRNAPRLKFKIRQTPIIWSNDRCLLLTYKNYAVSFPFDFQTRMTI